MKKLLQNFYLLFCFAFCMHSNAQSGKILSLDGTNSYMSVVDHADLDVAPGETKTITCWIKTTSTATARSQNVRGMTASRRIVKACRVSLLPKRSTARRESRSAARSGH